MNEDRRVCASSALKALTERSQEPLSLSERQTRIDFLNAALDAVRSGKVAESHWSDLLTAVDVCRRVILASRHDQAASQHIGQLLVEVRHARNIGFASALRAEAIQEVMDLFVAIINNCPAPLFERCEMQAFTHGSK